MSILLINDGSDNLNLINIDNIAEQSAMDIEKKFAGPWNDRKHHEKIARDHHHNIILTIII